MGFQFESEREVGRLVQVAGAAGGSLEGGGPAARVRVDGAPAAGSESERGAVALRAGPLPAHAGEGEPRTLTLPPLKTLNF